MSFIDQDFVSVEETSQYKDNFESNFNALSRNLTYVHALDYLILVKDVIENNKKNGEKELKDEQLK